MRLQRRFVTLFVIVFLAGCHPTAPTADNSIPLEDSAGRFADIDQDAVALRIGRVDELAAELSRQTPSLHQQMAKLLVAAKQKLSQARTVPLNQSRSRRQTRGTPRIVVP